MSAVLRPALAADAPAVADVLIASRKAFLPYANSAHAETEVREWVSTVLLPAGGVTVACDAQGAIVGVLATAREAGVSWIMQLYLAPAHVGRGTGSRLLAHALRELPPPVRLYTFQANEGARRFYERHGFRLLSLSDGQGNEERCPDALYEFQGEGFR